MKIEKLFDRFATGAATILSEKKDWSKVKRMSRAKNTDVWGQVWTKTARPAAMSALRSAKLGLSEKDIKALADDYGIARKPLFVRLTSQTDIKRLKKLARSKGDLEKEIGEAGISKPSRRFLMEDNESLEAAKSLLRAGNKQVGKKTKTWRTTSGKACKLCDSLNGEKRGIDEAYSNGSLTAHYHENCHCEDQFS